MRELNERERAALENLKRLIITILEEIRQFIILMLPVMLRGVCAVVGVLGTATLFYRAWAAYGNDELAVIPATMLAIAPTGAAMMIGLSWGGLLIGGLVALAGAEALSYLDLSSRILLIVAVLGAAVFYIARPSKEARDEKEQQHSDLAHCDRVADLHGVSVDPPGAEHSAR